MNWSIVKSTTWGAASLLGAALLAGPALADGMPSHGKIAAAESHPCTFSGNVGATTDYVFRGFSQTYNDPAVQGGVDATCGRFYFGFWGSNVDFGPSNGRDNVEMDLYAGIKGTWGRFAYDLGVIYYGYPGGLSTTDYWEFKAGASTEVWKGGTIGATVFYSPEYTGEVGPATTVEGTISQALPKFSIFTPTLSATLGGVWFSDSVSNGGALDYTYWNVGLTLGFREKWSIDVRYWDTDLDSSDCNVGGRVVCDGRVVGTVKYTF